MKVKVKCPVKILDALSLRRGRLSYEQKDGWVSFSLPLDETDAVIFIKQSESDNG
jgi:hypothetical protein